VKKITLALACLILTSCASMTQYLPTWRKFPEQKNTTLLQPCPDLETIQGDKVAVTELLQSIVKNYGLYYECSLKNDQWKEWYELNRKEWQTHKWKD